MRRKIKKFRGGGMDAGAGSDFKSPSVNATVNKGSDHSHSRFETGSGYYGETPTNTGSKGDTTVNKPPKKGLNIPVIGPVTAGLKIVQSLFTPKKQAHPFSANTIKQTKQKVAPPVGGGNDGPQLCPDGTYPPCKTPVTQIKKPVTDPNKFLSGFQSYDDGGEVVISSNVDKSLL